MNFSKSILSVAVLVSAMSASAYIGQERVNAILNSQAVEKFAFGFAALQGNVAPYMTERNQAIAAMATGALIGAYKFGYFGRAAKAVSNGFSQVSEAVAPHLSKRNALAVATGIAATGSLVAYDKGYFGTVAKAFSNGFSAVVANFASKK